MELQIQYLPHHKSAVNNNGMEKKKKRARCSSAKVEKNRRSHMKNLYATLDSLLPHDNPKKPLSVPDQIDEAINYIESLKTRLNESKEKKERLMGKTRSHACTNDDTTTGTATDISLKSPEMKINESGSTMEVVLMTGPDRQFMFYDMICIFHEHGAELLNASLSTVGDTVFQIVRAEIGAFVGAHVIKDELNRFVHGPSFEDELQQELWDFEFHPEMWDFSVM